MFISNQHCTIILNSFLSNIHHLLRFGGGASGVAELALAGVCRVRLRFGELSGVFSTGVPTEWRPSAFDDLDDPGNEITAYTTIVL